MNRANLKLRRDAEMQERTIENIKREASRRISEGKGRALDSNERLDFNRRVIKFKSLADSLKRTVATDQQKMGLQNKQIALEKLSKLKARMQFGDSTQKLNLAEQKLLLEIQSNLAEVQRLKLSRPDLPETKINLDLKRQSLQLRRTADSLQRQSSLRLMQEQAADKQSRLRARIGDEDIRIQESAAKIKNIISDLEKENIKIDLQKSWFALDNEQFIVDWKKMPQELYDTFKAKYLRPNGWGYYYGPVQVTGRGIFLDYSSLTR